MQKNLKLKLVIRVYGRLVFVSSRLAASLAKKRKASRECLSVTARQGCEQDAERYPRREHRKIAYYAEPK